MNPVNTKPYQLPADATWFGARLASAVLSRLMSPPCQRYIASLLYLDDNNPAILKLALDVTQPLAVNAAFKAAAAHFADSYSIDVVVNNAGYSLSGVTEHEMHDEFEVNFFGTVRVALKAIEMMRQSESRREGWSESVAREMHPDWNIHFCIVEPSALEMFVKKGLSAGVAFEPSAVANALYKVASRNEKVPLRLSLSVTAIKLIPVKLQGQLQDLETHGELSHLDTDQAQFKV
ncbi:hypothetical protein ETB97_001355 [Aspergillus alliaceus]|uniref:Uncharacterized protein n=1 Tax=Petromyces alliaceus TaxID=209559 RepID=A0A8H6E5V9_PETAA|nr:hypothetical protein ETB97_001355 [Aspergillus burnettii]